MKITHDLSNTVDSNRFEKKNLQMIGILAITPIRADESIPIRPF